jgi:hypothetical protein
VATLGCIATSTGRPWMVGAGLDLSRQRVEVHLLDQEGRTGDVTAATPEVLGPVAEFCRTDRPARASKAVTARSEHPGHGHDRRRQRCRMGAGH